MLTPSPLYVSNFYFARLISVQEKWGWNKLTGKLPTSQAPTRKTQFSAMVGNTRQWALFLISSVILTPFTITVWPLEPCVMLKQPLWYCWMHWWKNQIRQLVPEILYWLWELFGVRDVITINPYSAWLLFTIKKYKTKAMLLVKYETSTREGNTNTHKTRDLLPITINNNTCKTKTWGK